MLQQKGWKGTKAIKLGCLAALCKAKNMANAEQKAYDYEVRVRSGIEQ